MKEKHYKLTVEMIEPHTDEKGYTRNDSTTLYEQILESVDILKIISAANTTDGLMLVDIGELFPNRVVKGEE